VCVWGWEGVDAQERMARAAERIAAGAVGGGEESVLFTPGGSRLWQDDGGMGKEAGDEDVMAEVHVCCVLCAGCAYRQGGRGRRCHGRDSCVLRGLFGVLCVHVNKEAGDEDVMAEVYVCCVLCECRQGG